MLILQGFRNKFDSYVRKKKFFVTTQFDKIKKNSNNNNNNVVIKILEEVTFNSYVVVKLN